MRAAGEAESVLGEGGSRRHTLALAGQRGKSIAPAALDRRLTKREPSRRDKSCKKGVRGNVPTGLQELARKWVYLNVDRLRALVLDMEAGGESGYA